MIRSINHLYGDKLGALDAEIGQVKDLYFDDQSWAVRYVVADTGSWLAGRKVLISSRFISRLYEPGKLLLVNLTRKQIEESPSIESHKPVSRQFEEEYYRHHDWPFYWEGDAWAAGGYPTVKALSPPFPKVQTKVDSGYHHHTGADAHLCSTKAIHGYRLQASDGTSGHVCDFLMDDQDWTIRQLVIKTGHRISGTEVQLPTSRVDRICCEEAAVHVNVMKAVVAHSPEYRLPRVSL